MLKAQQSEVPALLNNSSDTFLWPWALLPCPLLRLLCHVTPSLPSTRTSSFCIFLDKRQSQISHTLYLKSKNQRHVTQKMKWFQNLLYSGVLLRWEFFIKMRAACFAPSFLQKRGVLEWEWLQVGSSNFNEKFLL